MQKLASTLVFTAASLEHLAECHIDDNDVAAAVFGQYGPARIRRSGRATRLRWFVVAPLAGGEFVTCVLRAAVPRDLDQEGVFTIPATIDSSRQLNFDASMRLCVSARVLASDEIRSYRNWQRKKRGSK